MSTFSELFAVGVGIGFVMLLFGFVFWLVEWFSELRRNREYTHDRINRAFDRIEAIEEEMEKRGEK